MTTHAGFGAAKETRKLTTNTVTATTVTTPDCRRERSMSDAHANTAALTHAAASQGPRSSNASARRVSTTTTGVRNSATVAAVRRCATRRNASPAHATGASTSHAPHDGNTGATPRMSVVSASDAVSSTRARGHDAETLHARKPAIATPPKSAGHTSHDDNEVPSVSTDNGATNAAMRSRLRDAGCVARFFESANAHAEKPTAHASVNPKTVSARVVDVMSLHASATR